MSQNETIKFKSRFVLVVTGTVQYFGYETFVKKSSLSEGLNKNNKFLAVCVLKNVEF
jgi:hypothetical protein